MNKLRQKELTQSFINKPCSLYITDRALKIVDRMSQVKILNHFVSFLFVDRTFFFVFLKNVAESIPLENIDPTCLESETPDTLNDIFMYRLYERHSNQLNNSTHSTNSYDRMSTVVVFKCSNKESKVLVDSIRSAAAKQLRQPRRSVNRILTMICHRHFLLLSVLDQNRVPLRAIEQDRCLFMLLHLLKRSSLIHRHRHR